MKLNEKRKQELQGLTENLVLGYSGINKKMDLKSSLLRKGLDYTPEMAKIKQFNKSVKPLDKFSKKEELTIFLKEEKSTRLSNLANRGFTSVARENYCDIVQVVYIPAKQSIEIQQGFISRTGYHFDTLGFHKLGKMDKITIDCFQWFIEPKEALIDRVDVILSSFDDEFKGVPSSEMVLDLRDTQNELNRVKIETLSYWIENDLI